MLTSEHRQRDLCAPLATDEFVPIPPQRMVTALHLFPVETCQR